MTRGPNKGEGGRPPIAEENRRTTTVAIRLTKAELDRLKETRLPKESLSSLMRRLALGAVEDQKATEKIGDALPTKPHERFGQ